MTDLTTDSPIESTTTTDSTKDFTTTQISTTFAVSNAGFNSGNFSI
jgi:hypothetical protein